MAEWIDIGLPEFGPGSVGDIAAHTTPVFNALRTVASEIHSKASIELLAHRDTGDAHIGVKHAAALGGVTELDSYVYLQDPGNSGAAFSIENGHWVGGYAKNRGDVMGGSEGPIKRGEGHWVPGLHPLGKAVKQAVQRGRARATFH